MKQNRALVLRTSFRITACTAVSVHLLAGAVTASIGRIATLDERITGAENVVIATVHSVTPQWRENSYGDRLIVSRIQLVIDETLKGGAARSALMEMEGGTLDGLTLRVSSLPLIEEPGDRAVFFLDSTEKDVYVPHLRGQGILFLDNDDLVRGSTLRLEDIRSRARALAR